MKQNQAYQKDIESIRKLMNVQLNSSHLVGCQGLWLVSML